MPGRNAQDGDLLCKTGDGPEGAAGQLPPVVPGAASALGCGVRERGGRGVPEGRVHAEGDVGPPDRYEAIGAKGMGRSELSRISATRDEQVRANRERKLEKRCPHLWLDALLIKVREGGRVVRKAALIATGVTSLHAGERCEPA